LDLDIHITKPISSASYTIGQLRISILTQFDNQLAGVCAGPVGFRGLPGLNIAFATHFGHSYHQTNFLNILHYRTAQNFNFNTV
jgi:hypothetical protein